MAEQYPKRTPESFWRWSRNVSALGGLALLATGFQSAALVGGLSAVGSEFMRQRHASKESRLAV